MSLTYIRRVWNNAQISGRPLTVLLALATRADRKGEVQVRLTDLQQQCRLNRDQCEGALEQLLTTTHIAMSRPNEQGRVTITLIPARGWTLRRATEGGRQGRNAEFSTRRVCVATAAVGHGEGSAHTGGWPGSATSRGASTGSGGGRGAATEHATTRHPSGRRAPTGRPAGRPAFRPCG